MENGTIENKVWIVLTAFCDMWYINDTRNLSGDTTLRAKMLKKPG